TQHGGATTATVLLLPDGEAPLPERLTPAVVRSQEPFPPINAWIGFVAAYGLPSQDCLAGFFLTQYRCPFSTPHPPIEIQMHANPVRSQQPAALLLPLCAWLLATRRRPSTLYTSSLPHPGRKIFRLERPQSTNQWPVPILRER